MLSSGKERIPWGFDPWLERIYHKGLLFQECWNQFQESTIEQDFSKSFNYLRLYKSRPTTEDLRDALTEIYAWERPGRQLWMHDTDDRELTLTASRFLTWRLQTSLYLECASSALCKLTQIKSSHFFNNIPGAMWINTGNCSIKLSSTTMGHLTAKMH